MSKPLSHLMDVYSAWLHLATTRAQYRQIGKSRNLAVSKVKSAGLTEMFTHARSGLVEFSVYVDTRHQTAEELLELCAHEATHVAGMLLDRCGTAYDGESETLAYLVGWLTMWLWRGCHA